MQHAVVQHTKKLNQNNKLDYCSIIAHIDNCSHSEKTIEQNKNSLLEIIKQIQSIAVTYNCQDVLDDFTLINAMINDLTRDATERNIKVFNVH